MTKGDLIKKDSFLNSEFVQTYDTALPQDLLNNLANRMSNIMGIDHQIAYELTRSSSVYVYAKNREEFLYSMTNDVITQMAYSPDPHVFNLPKSLTEFRNTAYADQEL